MKNQVFVSTPLLRLAVCLMAGIIIGQYVLIPMPLWPIFLSVVTLSLLSWMFPQVQSVAIAVCFLVLGALLMQRQKDSMAVVWPDREVLYEAVVLSEPVEKPKTMAVDILLTRNHRQLKCYLYKDARSRNLKIGDGLRIQSRIHPNNDWHIGTFNYRRYLEIHGFTGRTFVSSWKWQKARVLLKDLSLLMRTKLRFLQWRNRLLQRFSVHHQKDVQYGVVVAMVLGDKSALTKELKETYAVTGASHILALSGLHLSIIYSLLSLFMTGRRWEAITQIVIILSIWAYVFLVGMSTSVVRAAVMLSTYALLSLGHRDKMSVNTLAFAAMILLIANPLSLFDVGFQMSFLAVFSILVFYPLFEGVFSQEYLLTHQFVKWMWGMVAVSCAAQIGTAPLVAYYFGRFSTLFLLTNFIVIPAATLILYGSLVVLVIPSLASMLLAVVSLLNTVLNWIATIPYASIEGLHPSMLQVAMVYVIIASVWLLVVRLHRSD